MEYIRSILLLIKILQVSSITTPFDPPPRNFRRHIETPFPDWELGLREAAYQALLRERNLQPNLREFLYNAPLLGRQDSATPFGDIAILARGQLYSASGGFQLVQDPYQNDCDGCHNPPPGCDRIPCDKWKPEAHERLLALWTVKRIRHRDPNYGYRYELEYKVSPMSIETREPFLTRNGNFDYNLPGHTFIVKADPRGESGLRSLYQRSPNLYNSEWSPNFGPDYLPPIPPPLLEDRKKPIGFEITNSYLPPDLEEPSTHLKEPSTILKEPPIDLENDDGHELFKNLLGVLDKKTSTKRPNEPKPTTSLLSSSTTTPFQASSTLTSRSTMFETKTTVKFPTTSTNRIKPIYQMRESTPFVRYSEPDPLYPTANPTKYTTTTKKFKTTQSVDSIDIFGPIDSQADVPAPGEAIFIVSPPNMVTESVKKEVPTEPTLPQVETKGAIPVKFATLSTESFPHSKPVTKTTSATGLPKTSPTRPTSPSIRTTEFRKTLAPVLVKTTKSFPTTISPESSSTYSEYEKTDLTSQQTEIPSSKTETAKLNTKVSGLEISSSTPETLVSSLQSKTSTREANILKTATVFRTTTESLPISTTTNAVTSSKYNMEDSKSPTEDSWTVLESSSTTQTSKQATEPYKSTTKISRYTPGSLKTTSASRSPTRSPKATTRPFTVTHSRAIQPSRNTVESSSYTTQFSKDTKEISKGTTESSKSLINTTEPSEEASRTATHPSKASIHTLGMTLKPPKDFDLPSNVTAPPKYTTEYSLYPTLSLETTTESSNDISQSLGKVTRPSEGSVQLSTATEFSRVTTELSTTADGSSELATKPLKTTIESIKTRSESSIATERLETTTEIHSTFKTRTRSSNIARPRTQPSRTKPKTFPTHTYTDTTVPSNPTRLTIRPIRTRPRPSIRNPSTQPSSTSSIQPMTAERNLTTADDFLKDSDIPVKASSEEKTIHESDFENLFGKSLETTTKKSITRPTEKEGDEIFANEESTPKVIFSGFYSPSTVSSIEELQTESTAPVKIEKHEAIIEELPGNYEYKVYKAEYPRDGQNFTNQIETTREAEANIDNKMFDALTLSVVNHARSIDYLHGNNQNCTDETGTKRKYRRRVKKIKRRND